MLIIPFSLLKNLTSPRENRSRGDSLISAGGENEWARISEPPEWWHWVGLADCSSVSRWAASIIQSGDCCMLVHFMFYHHSSPTVSVRKHKGHIYLLRSDLEICITHAHLSDRKNKWETVDRAVVCGRLQKKKLYIYVSVPSLA